MKKWINISLWIIAFSGLITIGFYIKSALDSKETNPLKILILSQGENTFITDLEMRSKLELEGFIFDKIKRSEIEIEEIENFIKDISQVKSAEVYQAIDGKWNINVELREPIARIYNLSNQNFYLDKEGNTFKTTEKHTARVPIVSGEIHDLENSKSVTEIINNDSLISIRKLDDIYRISRYVCKDTLFHSLIGQIHLKKNGDFILVPLVGDQQIVFGSAKSTKEVEGKFKKLTIFYNEAIPYEGWTTYSEINLKFEDQIVCKKKGQ